MDVLRRMIDNIRKNLGAFTTAHKLLIACLAVMIFMGLGLVALWSGRRTMEDLFPPGTPAADLQKAAADLSRLGVETKSEGGRLLVASGDSLRARALLAQSGGLPGNKAVYFENLLANQNWMNSRQVNEQAYRIALQNELARMIAGLKGVESATVVLEIPDPQGLGAGARRPSASVAARAAGGQPLSQTAVDGIVNLVAGSVAGLNTDRVFLTDAGTGGKRTARTEESASPSIALEQAAAVEAQARAKIEDLLSYIPGVKVAVTAAVDVTRSVSETKSFLPEKQGTVSLDRKVTESVNSSVEAANAGTPGVEANQTADLTRGSAQGPRSENTETTTEKDNQFGSRTERVVDPKGQSTAVAVSVGVPRGYVLRLIQDAAPAPAAGAPASAPPVPADADILKRFDADVRPGVIAALTPHVRAMVAAANAGAKPDDLKRLVSESISVNMVPGDVPPAAPQAAGVLSGGVMGVGLGGGLIEKGVLGLLALLAMGMMIVMVRKGGKKADLPTAEELVGLPPALDGPGEVIGEADESETAMAGIEVGESEMQAQKMLEQVNEMVGKDPTEAGKLLSRWIAIEE